VLEGDWQVNQHAVSTDSRRTAYLGFWGGFDLGFDIGFGMGHGYRRIGFRWAWHFMEWDGIDMGSIRSDAWNGVGGAIAHMGHGLVWFGVFGGWLWLVFGFGEGLRKFGTVLLFN